MYQKQKYLDWTSSRAILFAIGLLSSTQTFAAGFATEAVSAELPAPAFLGGLALAAPAAHSTGSGVVYPAYDADAISRHLEPTTAAKAAGIDPFQTAAIIPGVFGSIAIPMKNFPVSARWAPIYRAINGCAGSACGQKSKTFATVVKTARDKGFLEKLDGINRGVNGLIAYKRDKAIYGSLDHWAKPDEILKRGAGDCEDFAILKMAALLDAGIPAHSMALVVLQDSQKGVFHAVLSVTTGSGTFILDNVSNNVVKDTSLPTYVPLYSFSTNRAWIHGSKAGSAQVAETKGGFASIAPGEGPQEVAPPRKAKKAGWMPAIDG
jgi:predicted transglutaminase-like cysteine proteinase